MSWLGAWEAFVKTVDLGSMAAAARRLDCSRAQVSKQLAELEQSFGARLIERTTRRQNLTPAGEVFYEHALRVLEELRDAELAVQNLVEIPRGILRIAAPVSFGRLQIAPLLPQFAAEHPLVQCELDLEDRRVDLIEENVDIALRLTDAPPENVVARKLTLVRRVICASPDYLARHGVPQVPQDLAHHECFAFTRMRGPSDWTLATPGGSLVTVPIRAKFQVNNLDSINAAVLQGHGLAILPTYLCGPDVARGTLVEVLKEYLPITTYGQHLYACYPASRVRLPKVRVFLQMLEDHFSPVPPWERSASG
ncbi:LysR family transcriptional regulator [Azoarcus sp. KH32C]|uniref:LysR family transcriptional regulator n=1 Tax=Azoarcus sp. KH32C TaxID=748247 RepID=UPI0002386B44|nr:LysR family transcriptional regulator [Azoarcus sp. KH32C]BAL23831.1 transcriptional regulator, LysR family [Azoarcus sp. KH32C]